MLYVKNINKFYGNFQAVKSLSFTLKEGEVYGILGRNGAGKTTTIRMIMGIYDPDSGEIKREFSEKDVSYLPEERGLYPKLTIKETLSFFGEIKGMSKKEIKNAKDLLLEKFDLTKWYNKKIENLSKGMQQKVQFIISIMNNPKFLILDEPFSGLDAINIQLFKDEMLEMKKKGTTILFSTHIIEHAENLCSNIMIIKNGEKIIDGPLTKIKKDFGKNTIFIRYEGNSAVLKNEYVETIDDYGTYAEIKLKNESDYNNYLKSIIGKLNIYEFKLDTPSLKSIFIESVGKEHENE